MGQHDYNIANQTFPNTRIDWNSLNTAILSNNSGASTPSTTAAYMFWADTTNSLFKMRNSGDSDWITLFGTDGKILTVDGSASLPSLSFSGDTNTGLFRPTTDVIGFANAGSESARLDASGNLGIGQNSPSYRLDILGTESTTPTSATLNIAHTTNPRIRFRGTTSNIRWYFGLDDTSQNLQWADDGGNVEMSLTQSGHLGIGTDSPDSDLEIERTQTTTYNAATVGGQQGSGVTTTLSNLSTAANTFSQLVFETNNNRVVNRIVSGHGSSTTDGFLAFVIEDGGTPAELARMTGSGIAVEGNLSLATDASSASESIIENVATGPYSTANCRICQTGRFVGTTGGFVTEAIRGGGIFIVSQRISSTDMRVDQYLVTIEDDETTVNQTLIGSVGSTIGATFSVVSGQLKVTTTSGSNGTDCIGIWSAN